MEEIQNYFQQITSRVIDYAPRLVLALLVLFIGLRVVNRLGESLGKIMVRSGLSEQIRPFLVSLFNVSLKILLAFSVASILGVDVTSFLAVLAAAGFAVGLALQGSLSNFAAGILILLFKHYRVGEWVEIDEKFGKVEAIQIFNTIITTPGEKTLIVPNGKVIEETITNYSRKGFIRMELHATMPYEEHFPRVQSIILRELEAIPKILSEPAPEVGIETFESHNVLIAVRPYVIPDDYWEVYFEVYQRIKAAFHDERIKVAYSEGVELGPIGS